ncbi:hypothetical protein [Nocardia otitidiscaviarum]|uniref:hypothetical protein n=1 Tax=Nocardia otitidiscaviarum TaxID=1823 RepID=UPI002458A5C4|nr:hypothetical protein [Nocardia otitidiscaviarum]
MAGLVVVATDHLLAVVLDVLADVEQGEVFGAVEVWRLVWPAIDPVPTLAEIQETLELLALPMLVGVLAHGGGTYRIGVPPDVVTARLAWLSDAVRQVDDDLLDHY